ncbi:MAG: cytochrome c maturation protein CcmE [Gallionella sp.]|nr:cytochrome c maturation protein CcmE [Gallionella sp.]
MKPRQKRFMFIAVGLAAISVAVGLVLYSLKGNVNLYFTPSDVFDKKAPVGKSFRIGGLVEEGSVRREKDGLSVSFAITDTHKTIPVIYTGILPDLFKEGKGVVAQGRMEESGIMRAEEVLAKHDENYMPPEALDAMNKAQAAKAAAASAPVVAPVVQ